MLIVVAIAGCGSGGRSPAVDASIGDVGPDAWPDPRNDPGVGPLRQPFDATFVTPAGTFDEKYLYAEAVWGDCNPPSWILEFATTETGLEPRVTLHVSMPPYAGVEVSGTRPASASYVSPQLVSYTTQSATFEATRIDYPADGAPRITGHFLVTDPAWTIDFDLDVLGISGFCI